MEYSAIRRLAEVLATIMLTCDSRSRWSGCGRIHLLSAREFVLNRTGEPAVRTVFCWDLLLFNSWVTEGDTKEDKQQFT